MGKTYAENTIMKTKQTRIIFCTPGLMFTKEFKSCWTDLMIHCTLRPDITFKRSEHYRCNIYTVRNMCLGVGGGRQRCDIKPFNGTEKYDWLMWIDSDQVYKTWHFDRILNRAMTSGYSIVSGTYRSILKADQKALDLTVAVHKADSPSHMTSDDIANLETDEHGLAEIHSNGFGWMMVKYGVFEALEFPWFRQAIVSDGEYVSLPGEDVVFSEMSRVNGFKTYLDPSVIIKHEKALVF